MIVVGFFIRNNVSTSEPYALYLAPILDSSKDLADYISKVALVDRPSLVYSKNDIKAVQNGGGFSVLHLLSLTIVHTTNFLASDTRQEIDVTIYDASFICVPCLNILSMIMSNYKVKEEMF